MDKLVWTVCILAFALAGFAAAPSKYEKDVIVTSQGDLEITFLGHGTLMMTFGGKTIHIDPYGDVADYGALPKADLVLVTHEHSDHLDPAALKAVLKPGTIIVAAKACAAKLPGAVILANGESRTVLGLAIEAVPAYNIVHERSKGNPFHPKGDGKRLHHRVRRQAGLRRRRHRDHAGDEGPQGHRRGVPAREPPLHDDAEMVADAVRAFRPKDPLPLPLRRYGHLPADRNCSRTKKGSRSGSGS